MAQPHHSTASDLLAELTLEEKVQLLTGRDFWSTWPMPQIGLRSIVLSDGPSGVRGAAWDERDPSLNLPSASALSSAWDRSIAARYGTVVASEARRKGVDVVLGPTINLHRSPYGGRHFEAFSEDPVLTAALAASYVDGVQAGGVGATPKHYVANDFETDRFTANVVVSERALRELYLLAFEKSIVESHAWLVMSAYNSINGSTATESDLLETPLNSEWGFDGVVVSDWTAVRSLESAKHSQDLVMPGPDGAWGDALVDAVRAGAVDESAIDRKVLRILRLAERLGALGVAATAPTEVEDGIAFIRQAASAGSVLLTNKGELPWSPGVLSSIAVIGHNATLARSQGGGSASVVPDHVVTPLEGIRGALPAASVSYSMGAVVQDGITALPLGQMTNPRTEEPGLLVRFLDSVGTELEAENRRSSALVWFGGNAPILESAMLELSTVYTAHETGDVLLGFASIGHAKIFVDDALVLDHTLVPDSEDLGAAFLAPPSVSSQVSVVNGVPITIRVEVDLEDRVGPLANALAFTFGLEAPSTDAEALIAEAVAAAKASDVALVVVGTNSRVESEGYDRESLALPGRQDDLVRAVAAVNPHTVVIVNSGSPVVMPWRDDVSAILVSYFGGQEMGNAIADVLLGVTEPGGRLPTTWPAAEADVPVGPVELVDGVVHYDEGIHIGYRAWLKSGIAPAYEFGHGLGYTSWTVDDVRVDTVPQLVEVEVTLSNTGKRSGKQVIQVYASREHSVVDRPVRWLVGFAPVSVESGESATVKIPVTVRSLANWDEGWQYEAGRFTLWAGTSVLELPRSASVEVATAANGTMARFVS